MTGGRGKPTLEDALAHHQAGRLAEAEAAYRAVIAAGARDPRLVVNLGVVLQGQGKAAEAADAYRDAIAAEPTMAEAHLSLGHALLALGDAEGARNAFATAVEVRPGYVDALNALAVQLGGAGDFEAAKATFERALAAQPDFPGTLNNLGTLHHKHGRLDDAEGYFRNALAVAPDYAEAHRNLSHVLLLQGRLAEGWPEFEWRWRCRDFPSDRRGFPQRPWAGEPLQGKTILVWGEQGVGDEVQFASLVPDLVDMGADVTLESDPRLVPVFGRSFSGVRCVARETPPAAALMEGAIDYQAPIGNLARWLRADRAAFPERPSFLVPNTERRDALGARYREGGDGLLVGIAWVSKNPEIGAQKSMALSDWRPLAAIPGIRFVDLQYGDTAAERARFETDTGVSMIHDDTVDQMADLDAFAAQVAAMDLVVSVSNTTVHMAGAMAVPVWVLVNALPLPVWMLEGDTSPWYPSVRLYRQARAGEWGDVIGRVAEALEPLARP